MATMDCYQILGVDRDADSKDIRRAYRKLAAQYHPDKVCQLPPKLREFADEEMRRINTAKETLLDQELRNVHDGHMRAADSVTGRSEKAKKTNGNGFSKPYTYGCPHCSARVSAIPIDMSYVMSCPNCNKQMTIPAIVGGKGGPSGRTSQDGGGAGRSPDRLAIYSEAMRRALFDGIITKDESYILDGLRELLHISPSEHQDVLFKMQYKR